MRRSSDLSAGWLSTFIAAAGITLVGTQTNITPGWFSTLVSTAGLVLAFIDFDKEQPLRRALCVAVALGSIGLCASNNSTEKAASVFPLAARQATQRVLDGADRASGVAHYGRTFYIKRGAEPVPVTAEAKIIQRKEPEGIGAPGRAEVEILSSECKGKDGCEGTPQIATRHIFEVVVESDGSVTYYEEVPSVKNFGYGARTHITLIPTEKQFWGKRGALQRQPQ